MRIFLFIIWTFIGLCLFLAGCRASIRAADLEASLELRATPSFLVGPPEVVDDKDSD